VNTGVKAQRMKKKQKKKGQEGVAECIVDGTFQGEKSPRCSVKLKEGKGRTRRFSEKISQKDIYSRTVQKRKSGKEGKSKSAKGGLRGSATGNPTLKQTCSEKKS